LSFCDRKACLHFASAPYLPPYFILVAWSERSTLWAIEAQQFHCAPSLVIPAEVTTFA
jgi:hypothetical protein